MMNVKNLGLMLCGIGLAVQVFTKTPVDIAGMGLIAFAVGVVAIYFGDRK